MPLRGDSIARREEGKKKDEVEGREGEESTPKPVAAGSYREVPLLFSTSKSELRALDR